MDNGSKQDGSSSDSVEERSTPHLLNPRGYVHDRNKGGEHPDPTPVHIPGNAEHPLSLRDEMRRFVREEISRNAAEVQGVETFEEANDFEEDDPEIEIITPYTVIDMAPDELVPGDDLEGNPEADNPPDKPGGEAAEGSEATETPAPSPVPKVE